MSEQKQDISTFEQVLVAAAVFGVVVATVLWLLTEHSDEVNGLFRMATGKARQWLD